MIYWLLSVASEERKYDQIWRKGDHRSLRTKRSNEIGRHTAAIFVAEKQNILVATNAYCRKCNSCKFLPLSFAWLLIILCLPFSVTMTMIQSHQYNQSCCSIIPLIDRCNIRRCTLHKYAESGLDRIIGIWTHWPEYKHSLKPFIGIWGPLKSDCSFYLWWVISLSIL